MSFRQEIDLRSVRRRLGLSPNDLAGAIGVSARTVRRWESSGVMSVEPDVARRIELVLEINALATETYGEDCSVFMDAPRISLRFRTPRQAMADGDLELVRMALIKTLEGDWT